MRTADFDYALPPDLIAREPVRQRDHSRLLVLHRASSRIEHRHFFELPQYLRAGDVLVLNNSRVVPARMRGANARTGGEFEMLLLEERALNDWWVMLRPGKRARVGTRIQLRDSQGKPSNVEATVMEVNAEGHRLLRFSGTKNIFRELDSLGEVPLPPYIERSGPGPSRRDRNDYQTVFAGPAGSVAAPTAGLHFSHSLLDHIRALGIQVCFLTLHVGLGTFAPVKSETISGHVMHEERFELNEPTAQVINTAKREGCRVIAVGTTTARVLESVATQAERASGGAKADTAWHPAVRAGTGRTQIFIYSPYEFKIVDALLTNFHLPRSTLLMLVSAFAAPNELNGREKVLNAYAEAIRLRYRFYSYGDAMLVV